MKSTVMRIIPMAAPRSRGPKQNKKAPSHIVVVAKNSYSGNDLVVGDIHGGYENFEILLNSLKVGDRLFLPGDLTDRGENSLGVIEAIIREQKKYPDRINVTRGNHENLCLDSISGLEQLAKVYDLNTTLNRPLEQVIQIFDYLLDIHKTDKKMCDAIEKIKLHQLNGGDWLTQLFFTECNNGKIKRDQLGNLQYQDDSKVKMVKEFMSNLPYITYADDPDNPF